MALKARGLVFRGLPVFETFSSKSNYTKMITRPSCRPGSLFNCLLNDLVSESTPNYRCHYCKILFFVECFRKPYKLRALCRAAKSIGAWELGSEKIFSFARKFFNKSFLTQGEDYCSTISSKKIFFDSSILLIHNY